MAIHSFAVLFPVRFFMVLFAGALEPALNVWLAKRVPEARQGVAFGLASTTRSIGWAIGPLLAGLVAAVNLRAVFGVGSVGFLGLALLFALGLRARQKSDTKDRMSTTDPHCPFPETADIHTSSDEYAARFSGPVGAVDARPCRSRSPCACCAGSRTHPCWTSAAATGSWRCRCAAQDGT